MIRMVREGRDVTDEPWLWAADDVRLMATNFPHPAITTGQHTNGPATVWIMRDDGDWVCTGERSMHKVRQRLIEEPEAWKTPGAEV